MSSSTTKTNDVLVRPNLKDYVTNCKSPYNDLDDNPSEIVCLLCDSKYILPTNEQDFLAHLFQQHQLVIGDVDKIASLKSYVRYWKRRFNEIPLSTICVTMTMGNSKTSSSDTKCTTDKSYYLLSDCVKEDKTLRYELFRAKLEWALAEQLKERTDTTFKRGCMFCKTEFSGSRIEYIKHLGQKHNILLGKPENLVFIDEFLDKIQNSIENFICLYCEKKFKDRFVLKEHMRKKLHKQVNPNNSMYDKYYIVNYTHEKVERKRRKSVSTVKEEDPSGFSSNSEDDDWSDWNNEIINITCLLCSVKTEDISKNLEHMKTEHKFNFEEYTKDMTFYQKVKVVNYIRSQIQANKCIYCDTNADQINVHMINQNHYKLPSKSVWDQPGFFFPMSETDSFLYSLDTDSDTEEVVCSNL